MEKKKARNLPLIQEFNWELTSVVKRQWMRNRLMQLEEQIVGYHCQAFEIKRQRLKWLKFSSKKEREMEARKLANERLRLQNERMVLLLRKKEMESIDFQQGSVVHQNLCQILRKIRFRVDGGEYKKIPMTCTCTRVVSWNAI
ncbi:hypothetical protein LguiA_028560 [Lonicera macranthoides]